MKTKEAWEFFFCLQRDLNIFQLPLFSLFVGTLDYNYAVVHKDWETMTLLLGDLITLQSSKYILNINIKIK